MSLHINPHCATAAVICKDCDQNPNSCLLIFWLKTTGSELHVYSRQSDAKLTPDNKNYFCRRNDNEDKNSICSKHSKWASPKTIYCFPFPHIIQNFIVMSPTFDASLWAQVPLLIFWRKVAIWVVLANNVHLSVKLPHNSGTLVVKSFIYLEFHPPIVIAPYSLSTPGTIFSFHALVTSATEGGKFICLSIFEQDISNSYGWIRTKLHWQVGCVTRPNWLDFGEDPARSSYLNF